MRTLLILTLLIVITGKLVCQQQVISIDYQLIASIDFRDGNVNSAPSYLLLSPGQKYMLAAETGKDGKLHIFEVSSGKRLRSIEVEKRFIPSMYYFDGDQTVYLATKKGFIEANLANGQVSYKKCKNLENQVCKKMIEGPIWTGMTWENGRIIETYLHNLFVIKRERNKVHLYYNLNH